MSGYWLALDTATEEASAAAGVPPAVAAVARISGARRHAAEILRLVDEALRGPGLRPADLAGIVVADGPGSFTGLRIGWAAARGLAHEHDVPLVAIPALLAAARGAALDRGGTVAACFDALRGQVYGAVYRFNGVETVTLVEPAVLTMAQLIERAPERPRVAVGDGAVRFAADVAAWTGAEPLALSAVAPNAESLLRLIGREGIGRRIEAADAPVYGRPAEAQARWEARHGRPLPDPTGPAG